MAKLEGLEEIKSKYGKYQDSADRIEKIEAKYDSKAKKIFSQPAEFCQFCGQPMEDTGNELTDRWQRRWSIHAECAEQVENQLDRSIGILGERAD